MSKSINLSDTKACVVAIGLIEDKRNYVKPLAILGSGFFVNKEGFVLTAGHVFRECAPKYQEFAMKGIKTIVVAFHVTLNREGLDFNVLPLTHIKVQELYNNAPSQTLDIGVGIPGVYCKSVPYLEIKNFNKSILFKDIIMCGYPSGNLSLGENDSLRLSPIIQFGRVTGLMPTDTYSVPWGIQTDIIGTGGSSGSPLIDASDGKVIGIAQKVLPASVEGDFFGFIKDEGVKIKKVTGKFGAAAKIGLVYGNTSRYFIGLHKTIKENHDKGIKNTKHAVPTVGLQLVNLKTGPLDMTRKE